MYNLFIIILAASRRQPCGGCRQVSESSAQASANGLCGFVPHSRTVRFPLRRRDAYSKSEAYW